MIFDEWFAGAEELGLAPKVGSAAYLLLRDAWTVSARLERERCAKVAEQRADFHRVNCHKSCSCADGWHIALAIRAGKAATEREDFIAKMREQSDADTPQSGGKVADES